MALPFERALAPGDSLESYRLIKLLAEGNQARVFIAEDPQGRTLALKVCEVDRDPDLDPQAMPRFEQEGKIHVGCHASRGRPWP